MTEILDQLGHAVMAYPLAALLLLSVGPVVIVARARSSTGSVIVVGGTVLVLVLALTTNVITPVLVALALLWVIAIGFVIFGRARRPVAR